MIYRVNAYQVVVWDFFHRMLLCLVLEGSNFVVLSDQGAIRTRASAAVER